MNHDELDVLLKAHELAPLSNESHQMIVLTNPNLPFVIKQPRNNDQLNVALQGYYLAQERLGGLAIPFSIEGLLEVQLHGRMHKIFFPIVQQKCCPLDNMLYADSTISGRIETVRQLAEIEQATLGRGVLSYDNFFKNCGRLDGKTGLLDPGTLMRKDCLTLSGHTDAYYLPDVEFSLRHAMNTRGFVVYNRAFDLTFEEENAPVLDAYRQVFGLTQNPVDIFRFDTDDLKRYGDLFIKFLGDTYPGRYDGALRYYPTEPNKARAVSSILHVCDELQPDLINLLAKNKHAGLFEAYAEEEMKRYFKEDGPKVQMKPYIER